MSNIVYLDLFSGIGGFSEGFKRAGWAFDTHYFSEIDKHAIAVYQHHFPNAKLLHDVTTIYERTIERPNLVTFGFPCQDLSVAGKQKGLGGERSGLFFEAIRIIEKHRPEFFIFENVKGLLSSDEGKDFEVVLRTIADLGVYDCEWQLVNTKWLLPQNRERVYFVGHLRGASIPKVFPFRGCDFKASPNKVGIQKQIASTLTTAESKVGRGMNCIKIKSAVKQGYEVAEEGDSINFSVPSSETRRGRVGKKKAQTLDTQSNQAVVIPTPPVDKEVLATGLSMERTNKGKKMRKKYEDGEETHGFNEHRTAAPRKDGLANTLDTVEKSRRIVVKPVLTPDRLEKSQQDRVCDVSGKMATLGSHRLESKVNIKTQTSIRRLTEIECERLQGFEDNWTAFGNYDGEVKPVSKTQRYKQLGNAVTVDIVEMIANRLK